MYDSIRYMDEETSLAPLNEKKQCHGHWVVYQKRDGTFWYECNYIDGAWYGYFEHHFNCRITKEYAAR